jgi:hypothetical protein
MENPHDMRAAPAGRMLNQQWAFILESTKMLTAQLFFPMNCIFLIFRLSYFEFFFNADAMQV